METLDEHRRIIVVITIVLTVVLLMMSDGAHRLVEQVLARASAVVQEHPVGGALLFPLLSAVSAIAMFFSSAIIVPVAVYTWGRAATTALLAAGWLAGGALTYLLGRYPGRRLVRWLAPTGSVSRYERLLAADSSLPLVIAFQLAVPSEIPGYVLGSLRYPFLRYFAVLLVAEIPWAIGAVYLGDSLVRRDYALLTVLALAGIAFSSAAVLFFRARLRRSHAGNDEVSHDDPVRNRFLEAGVRRRSGGSTTRAKDGASPSSAALS